MDVAAFYASGAKYFGVFINLQGVGALRHDDMEVTGSLCGHLIPT
jgi:hypothetical protein